MPPGPTLGPFKLLAPAARGGMATVWRAEHIEQGTPVAVKVITGPRAEDPEYRTLFRDEVHAVAALDHPGVVLVLDYGEVDAVAAAASEGRLTAGSPWLAMEWASAGTLKDQPLGLPWSKLRPSLLSILDALAHAHARGVIHRDLKPGNLLIAGAEDPRPGLKLTDFGIALSVGEGKQSGMREDWVAGTPMYMAPEQVTGSWRDIGPHTDLYALGCLVTLLATGEGHFPRGHRDLVMSWQLDREPVPFRPVHVLPRGFDTWLARLLAKKPSDRFCCAADASDALSRLQAAGSPGSPTIPRAWRRTLPPPRSPHLTGVGLGLYGLRSIPMVGRQAERDLLWSELRAAAETGKARVVVLRGPAGAGKSRLVQWMSRRAHELAGVTTAKASHGPELAPGEALNQLGNHYLRTAGLRRAAVEERVRRWLDERQPAESSEIALLTEILCPALPEDSDPLRPPVRLDRPSQFYATTRNAMRRASVDRPLITWLDDVQWGVHGLGLARFILRTRDTSPHPNLLLLTCRDEALADRPEEAEGLARLLEMPHVRTLSLDPLTPADSRRLVRELLGLEPALAAQVEDRCGGNPLFAVQLVGDWVRRGALQVKNSGFTLRDDANPNLPDDLHAVWTAHVDRVLSAYGDRARHYLEVAAILGPVVDRDEWDQACDDPQGVFAGRFPGDRSLRAELVGQLFRERLAVGTVQQWSFVHGMLRESLERGATEHGRAAAQHLACATMLWARAPVPHLAPAERLGRHLLAADLWAQAIEPLLGGVEQRLITAGPQLALSLLATTEQVMTDISLPAGDKRWGRLWTLRGRIQAGLGAHGEALELHDRALAAATTHGWQGAIRYALDGKGTALLALEQTEAAQAIFEQLRVISEATGATRHRGRALEGLARVSQAQSDHQRAVDLLRDACDAYTTADDHTGLADALRLRGTSERVLGRPEVAADLLVKASARYEAIGAGLGTAECYAQLAAIYWELGDLSTAEDGLRRATSLFDALGAESGTTTRLLLCRVLAQHERPDQVLTALAPLHTLLEGLDREVREATAQALDLVEAGARGDWATFDRLVDRVRPREPVSISCVHIANALAAHRPPPLPDHVPQTTTETLS